VTYTAVINLGDYESERIEITAELEPGDTVSQAIAWCREHVDANTFQRKWLYKNSHRAEAKPAGNGAMAMPKLKPSWQPKE
jgi:hypothetical protein